MSLKLVSPIASLARDGDSPDSAGTGEPVPLLPEPGRPPGGQALHSPRLPLPPFRGATCPLTALGPVDAATGGSLRVGCPEREGGAPRTALGSTEQWGLEAQEQGPPRCSTSRTSHTTMQARPTPLSLTCSERRAFLLPGANQAPWPVPTQSLLPWSEVEGTRGTLGESKDKLPQAELMGTEVFLEEVYPNRVPREGRGKQSGEQGWWGPHDLAQAGESMGEAGVAGKGDRPG